MPHDIKAGDRVTFWKVAGSGPYGVTWKLATGRAVMRGPYGWVLNMGGRYGTPAVADERNIVRVTRGRKR